MTKADLIESVAATLDLPKGQAERAVQLVFEDIVKALRNADKVNISGFGTFAVSERKARTGRNPKTGESIDPRVEVGEVQSRQGVEGRAQVARTRPGG